MPVHVVQAELTTGNSGKLIINLTVDYIIDRIEITSTGALEITESSVWEDLEAQVTGSGLTVRTSRELNGSLVMVDLGSTMRNQLVIGLSNSSGSTQKLDVQIQTINQLQAVHKYGTVFSG